MSNISDCNFKDFPISHINLDALSTSDLITTISSSNRVEMPTQECVKEIIQETIDNYDKTRLFSDDILATLLADKIEEEIKTQKKIAEIEEKREKKTNIDSFINTIKATYFVPHQGLTKVIWKDGTQTEVRCQDGDEYNPETGLALCIVKYLFGNINYYNEIFKSVFEKNNSIKENPSVKKKKKTLPKKRKRFPSQEKRDFEW